MTQAWNPSQTCVDITLSGSNLIGTKAANGGINGALYAVTSVTTGRYYWEVTGTGTGAGIGNTASSIVAGQYLGNASNSIAWFNDATVFNAGGSIATWATYVNGNTLAFALDLSSNKLWGRVGAAGNWNNAAIGSQNPAVGSQVGGLAIPVGVTGSPVVPGGNLTAISDTITGNFASGSWVGTPPAGFGPFDVVAGSGLGRTLLLGVGGSIVRRDFRPIRALLGGRES